MQFILRKKKSAPAVIIISLINVLLVVLIFLMVTTTTKQQPSMKLALPEAHEPKSGATDNALIVTIPKTGPIYFKTEPVTFDTLEKRMAQAVQENPQSTLAIRADTDAPWGNVVKVMEAAKAANLRVANAFIKTPQ